ncbi:helix-turn-helix transcriptional regulator [Nocardioides gilvus]|uniref:helix-turn-helix transcriptional regulator n=1 Tax=Nocardioides gilvus TaxID=1735589 RepID=UPI000D74039F|nr:WYL domain-containing protein [Nocardioides gilvus]
MSASRSERLLNLLIMLLVQQRYVPKERIRQVLYPDQAGDAFDRMFDRDKEELRALGVPIEVGQLSAYFDDEVGYRIRPDDLALPEIALTAEEASVLTLAGKVWHHATLADSTAAALRKLVPGLPLEAGSPLSISEPRITAEEPTFDDFWTATQERRTVTFDYRTPGSDSAGRRRLEPWGVIRESGRWYVLGLDVDRKQERIFRLSRVEGATRLGTRPDAFQVPAGTDVREVARRLKPATDKQPLDVLLRTGAGHALRRRGTLLASGVSGPDGADHWDRLRVEGALSEVSAEVLTLGTNAFAESPPEFRDHVGGRLDQLVAALSVPTTGTAP